MWPEYPLLLSRNSAVDHDLGPCERHESHKISVSVHMKQGVKVAIFREICVLTSETLEQWKGIRVEAGVVNSPTYCSACFTSSFPERASHRALRQAPE